MKELTNLQKVVNRYLEIKHGIPFNDISYNIVKVAYRRNSRPAKTLLELCDNDVQEAITNIEKAHKWGRENRMAWGLEVVSRMIMEPDNYSQKDVQADADSFIKNGGLM